ncbi:MAG: hypothetical protein COV60_01840, partial [Candidatus Magasanikbacteria bacterium CG11_big_fil_rev_8_21_14_0_20_43_7]
MDRDVQTKKQTWQRKGVMLFLTVFLLMQGVLLLYPVPARAFPVNSKEVGSVPETEKKIGDQIVEAILSALLGSLVNMASYFMRTLAYDTASYIASGGHGQGSLIFEKPFDEYLGDVALDSVGEAVSSLGSQWGMDLCQPPELKLQAQLKIGLDKALQDPKKPGASPGSGSGRPQAKCSWQKLSENWKDGPLKVDVDVDFAANLAGETNIMETDFGFTIDALNQLEEYKTAQKEVAALNRQVNEGFKSVSDKVSGYINTPASLVKEEATALTGKHQGEQNAEQIAGMYASELWQIIP